MPGPRPYVTNAERGVKGLLVRVTLAEWASLLKLLADDDLSVQSFLSGCVQAYLRADGPMRKVVENYKRLSMVSPQDNRGHILSQLERRALYDAIEPLPGEDDE